MSTWDDKAISGKDLQEKVVQELASEIKKRGLSEVIAEALVGMAARIESLEAALAERNIGERVADSVDAQELKVGGVDVLTLGGDYAPKNHASTATTYGQSTTSNYGHAKLNNDTLNANSTGTAGVACSTGHKHSNLATSGAIGSGNQPVYFNADGYPTVIPKDPTYSGYLTLAVLTAREAVSANSAGSAAKLTNTSAIGSGNQPVYFNNQGVPIVIPFDSTYSDYLTLAVLTARAATVATSAGSATRLSNTGNIGSGNQPVYFSSQGVPTVVPFDSTYPQYLTLAVLTAMEAVSADSAGSATTATRATTASKLDASGGSTSQPVYFPSTGTNAGKPVPIPISTDHEIAEVGDFLTMQVQGAYYAHNAGTAGSAAHATKAAALDVSAAVGSALQPVYINANGIPTPIDALSPPVSGHNYMVLEVTSAQYAASAGEAGNAASVSGYKIVIGAYAGTAGTIYLC